MKAKKIILILLRSLLIDDYVFEQQFHVDLDPPQNGQF